MSDLPINFIADLRYPIAYPGLDEGKWFQWRSIPMIELSVLDTYRFVHSMLPHPAQQILEIGCGSGYLTLELARPLPPCASISWVVSIFAALAQGATHTCIVVSPPPEAIYFPSGDHAITRTESVWEKVNSLRLVIVSKLVSQNLAFSRDSERFIA